jgi:hypothetical protein
VVDLNGDGVLDLLLVNENGPNSVWLNMGILVFNDGFESGGLSRWSESSP